MLRAGTTKQLKLAHEMKPIFHPRPRECEEGSGHVVDQKRPGLVDQQQWRRMAEHKGIAMPVGTVTDHSVARCVTERFSLNMKQDLALSSSYFI